MVSNEIKTIVCDALANIEREDNVCIFYACESGSRAWEFEIFVDRIIKSSELKNAIKRLSVK